MPSTRPLALARREEPHSIRSVVDFPAPFGPRKPYSSPARTRRSRWSTAMNAPKRLVSPFVRTAGSAAVAIEREARPCGKLEVTGRRR